MDLSIDYFLLAGPVTPVMIATIDLPLALHRAGETKGSDT
jgi:hypothetical protein